MILWNREILTVLVQNAQIRRWVLTRNYSNNQLNRQAWSKVNLKAISWMTKSSNNKLWNKIFRRKGWLEELVALESTLSDHVRIPRKASVLVNPVSLEYRACMIYKLICLLRVSFWSHHSSWIMSSLRRFRPPTTKWRKNGKHNLLSDQRVKYVFGQKDLVNLQMVLMSELLGLRKPFDEKSYEKTKQLNKLKDVLSHGKKPHGKSKHHDSRK